MDFESVYNKYANNVYSYIKFKIADTYLVEDIFQETFISLYKDISNGKDINNMKSYLLTIARRRIVDKLRTIGTSTVNIDELHEEITQDDTLFTEEIYIKDLISKLDPISSEIIYGIYVENLTYKELAEILQLPEGTIKSKCFYTRRKLREVLQKEF